MNNQVKYVKKITVLKSILWLFFAACILFSHSASVQAEETNQEVTIYGMDSGYVGKVDIPDTLNQSYTLPLSDKANFSYRITSGKSVKVSLDGVVSPAYEYWKWSGGIGVSGSETDYTDYELIEGDTCITVTDGTNICKVVVHVMDYIPVYCNDVMDKYIDDNYNAGMSDLELMKMIARFPAGYDYDYHYSGVYSMIINGGGDCWASTSAIIKLSERLNLKKGLNIIAWSRNGNRDAGAGSGHMNAMTEYNGKYYELEAGYSSSKGSSGYRPYHVTERSTLYCCHSTASGVEIYQYDAKDTTGKLVIPDTINGKTVTSIAKSAFSGEDFSEIVLPDTLTDIGDFAFSGCDKLEKITIPASVTSIGNSIFSRCYSLTDISVALGNQYYKSADGAIYSKDGSVLLNCPGASNVIIPSTVTKIADYAFYYNENIKEIVIPESVTELGEGAFGNCSKLAEVTFDGNGLNRIGSHCFRYDYALSMLRLPASVKEVGTYAFASCSKLKYVFFTGDAPDFGDTIDGKYYDYVFSGCTVNAYYPKGNTTYDNVLTDHNGTVTWIGQENTVPVSLSDAYVTLEEGTFKYTGKAIEPEPVVTLNGVTLVKNTDYIVSYANNTNVGTAAISVVGIGSYSGKTKISFKIEKAERSVSLYYNSYSVIENDIAEVSYIWPKDNCTFTSSDTSVAVVDEKGTVTGVGVGMATITVTVAETDNYLSSTTTRTITVTHDTDVELLDDTVTDGKVKARCPRCNLVVELTVPTYFYAYWYEEGSYSGSTAYKKERNIGEKLECSLSTPSVDLRKMEIISMNERVITITDGKYVNFIADGTAQVMIRPKYNSAIARTYTFIVGTGIEKHEHDYSAKIIQNASCTESEITEYTCKGCGDTYTQNTKGAAGHRYDSGKVVQSKTCEQSEITKYTCEDCGIFYTQITQKAQGHHYDNGKVVQSGTCEQPEIIKYTCGNCGEYYTETTKEAQGHSYKEELLQKGSCEKPQITKYTCENCGKTYEETDDAAGHSYNDGKVTQQGTCELPQIITYTCKNCGKTYEETDDAVGHSYNNGIVTQVLTCEQPEITTYTCINCGYFYRKQTKAATGHIYNGEVTQQGTCEQPEITTYICEGCGKSYTKTTKEVEGHCFDNGNVIQKVTCRQPEITEYTCLNCDFSYTRNTKNKTEHVYDSGVVTKNPTTEMTGIKTYTCINCGATKKEIIDKLIGDTEDNTQDDSGGGNSGETSEESVKDDNSEKDDATDDTEIESGKEESSVGTSQETGNVSEPDKITEELSVGDIFSVGEVDYEITSDNTVKYIGGDEDAVSVVVPSYVNGFKVTSIDEDAFKNNLKLKKVEIGKNVTSIGANAFSGCKKLKIIMIKSTKIKKIGKNALKGIKKNAIIKVPKSKYAAYKKMLTSKTGFKKTMRIKK